MLLVEKSGSGDGGILALRSSTSFHTALSLSRLKRSSIADLSNADQFTSFSLSISLLSLSGTLTLTTVDIYVCDMFTYRLQIKIAIQILAEMHIFTFESHCEEAGQTEGLCTGMYTCLCMTTKNLAIREEVYRKLAQAKHQDESFSDVIERLVQKRGSLLPLWGALSESENLSAIERDIAKIRRMAMVRA